MTTPSRRYGTEADDSTGAKRDVLIPTEGDARIITATPETIELDALFEDREFYEEKVLIVTHPVYEGQSVTRLISVSVNGDSQYLVAGTPTWVRRKFVEQLVKARPDLVYHTSDDPSAERMNILTTQSTSKYNFDVLEDTPRGKAWLIECRKRWMNA